MQLSPHICAKCPVNGGYRLYMGQYTPETCSPGHLANFMSEVRRGYMWGYCGTCGYPNVPCVVPCGAIRYVWGNMWYPGCRITSD